jgi:hypothetical protein
MYVREMRPVSRVHAPSRRGPPLLSSRISAHSPDLVKPVNGLSDLAAETLGPRPLGPDLHETGPTE